MEFLRDKAGQLNLASYGESWLFQPDELVHSSASAFLRIDNLTARCAHRKFLFGSMKVLNGLHATSS